MDVEGKTRVKEANRWVLQKPDEHAWWLNHCLWINAVDVISKSYFQTGSTWIVIFSFDPSS